jgi:hypothetical protein
MQKFSAHCDGLRATCSKLGVSHHLLPLDQPIELGLFEFLQERETRGHHARPSARNAGGSR